MGMTFLFQKIFSQPRSQNEMDWLLDGWRKYPPVIGVAISESFSKRIAGDLELGYLKQTIQPCYTFLFNFPDLLRLKPYARSQGRCQDF